MPETSRDFQKAAVQRLTTAAFLLEHKYNLDAFYLTGYAVECTLKALILRLAERDGRGAEVLVKIGSGAKMHNAEVLSGLLKDAGISIPPAVKAEINKVSRTYHWTTALRYETHRLRTDWTRGFVNTARVILEWVEGQL